MATEKKKENEGMVLGIAIAIVIAGAFVWWIWVTAPDTRKMSDEQYMLWQKENSRQYP